MNLTTFYLFLCIIFSGRGDERWKKQTRDNLHNVGGLDEYTEMDRDLRPNADVDAENEFYSYVNYRLPTHKKHRKIFYNTRQEYTVKKSTLENYLSNSLYISNNRLKNISKDMSMDLIHYRDTKDSYGDEQTTPKWPKFEDLLLSVGVKYDFKSDRWVKIKSKHKKNSIETDKNFNIDPNHQKHEFKYRTIRINGGKKRKNIIIALTAIR